MSLNRIPGFTGFQYARVSSMNGKAIGKLTDRNHLQSMQSTDPMDYDKKIISLYTQSSLYANDFLNMISGNTPFGVEGNTDTWKWDVEVPYRFPKIIEVPDATWEADKPGVDGKELTLVFDTDEFSKNVVISLGSKMHGPRLYVIKDPQPWGRGFLYTFTLITENPNVDFVNKKFLQVGVEAEFADVIIGEFDQELAGLPRMGDKIEMFETLGSAYGFEHTITKWADQRTLKDSKGRALDLLVYGPKAGRNSLPIKENHIRWEPFVEYEMRRAMMENKVRRMIWSKPGSVKTNGSKQEIKKVSAGVYHRMKNNGNFVPVSKGEFGPNLIRTIFGDLFYRRVDVKDREVLLFTNEAGFDLFQQSIKEDALNSGLTLNAGSSDKFIQGSGQQLVYNWAFDSMVTRETGKVRLVHLKELDLPQTNIEFAQNKKSAPVFMVFDVSNGRDGNFSSNVREVRRKEAPSMTWGYIDGRAHHLGFAKSQGMSSASMFPGYKLWMEDRADVFIEDTSRTVLIEVGAQI
jgi:hypothetical protein